MSKTAEIEAFQQLRRQLIGLAASNSACKIDYESEKVVLLRMGNDDDMSLLEASIGSFELRLSSGEGLNYEPLRNGRDVDRAMALCDAVVAGRGVSLSGPNGYPTRSWIFLDSHGLKEVVTTTAVSIRSCRRARSINRSSWQRKRLPILKAESA